MAFAAAAAYQFPIWTRLNPAPISVYTGLILDSQRSKQAVFKPKQIFFFFAPLPSPPPLHPPDSAPPRLISPLCSRGHIAIWVGRVGTRRRCQSPV